MSWPGPGLDDQVPHFIYRHYDTEGRVLYVGCTMDVERRSRQHARRSPWWPQVARVETVGTYPTRREGLAAELAEIVSLRPAFNRRKLPAIRVERAARQPKHGYGRYSNGCRCDVCCDAKATYVREKRRRRAVEAAVAATPGERYISPTAIHGTRSGYVNHKCRCIECCAANAAAFRRQYHAKRAAA